MTKVNVNETVFFAIVWTRNARKPHDEYTITVTSAYVNMTGVRTEAAILADEMQTNHTDHYMLNPFDGLQRMEARYGWTQENRHVHQPEGFHRDYQRVLEAGLQTAMRLILKGCESLPCVLTEATMIKPTAASSSTGSDVATIEKNVLGVPADDSGESQSKG